MSDYVLTEEAERDLNEIWNYIAGESIEQADADHRDGARTGAPRPAAV
jgi:plasmid stabilization system protein ParE